MLRVLLILFTAVNVGYGLFALVFAERAAELVGLVPAGPAAHGEIRAIYGGLVLGLGAMTWMALLRPAAAEPILRALSLGFAGLALGRAASLGLDGWTLWNGLLLVGEGGAGLFLFWAAPRLAPARCVAA